MSGIRGAGFGIGAAFLYGGVFGATLGVLSTVGQAVAYHFGVRPTMDYQPVARARLTKHMFFAGVNRTVGYTCGGFISALMAHRTGIALSIGLKFGLVFGVVTGIASACFSYVEWGADHVPEKSMGVFGVGLILIGFGLQSVQYWVALLDVSVRS
jgi:hypothetical protein